MTHICEFDRSPLHENRVNTEDLRPTRLGSYWHHPNSSADRDGVIRNRSEMSSESGFTFQSSRKVSPLESINNRRGCSESSSAVPACKQFGGDDDSENFSSILKSQHQTPVVPETDQVKGRFDVKTNGTKNDAAVESLNVTERSRKRKRRSSDNEISLKRRLENSEVHPNECGDCAHERKSDGSDTHCTKEDKNGHLIMTPGKLIKKYKVLKVIGEGAFGRVAECENEENNATVALKVVRSSPKYSQAARLEIKVIRTLMDLDPRKLYSFVSMYDSFKYRDHVCIVFEKLGSNLYDFQKDNRHSPFPPHHVQVIAYQLISAVKFMHDHKLIHTDLKPENILFVNDDFDDVCDKVTGRNVRVLRSPKIRIIDFGSSTYEHQYHSRVVSTRHYRAPEVILELKWSYPCDVWSIGCILFEAFTGIALFMTHDNVEHLAMIERALGQRLSSRLVRRTNKRRYFHHGRLDWDVHSKMGRYVRDHIRHISRYFSDRTRNERYLFRLTRDLLACHPDDRISLRSALRHPYFDDDVLDNPILTDLKNVLRS